MVSTNTCPDDRVEELLKSFLNGTLKELMSKLKAECGSLLLLDDKSEEIVLNSFYNSVDLPIRGLRKKAYEGVAGKVLQLKQPVLVTDIKKDSRFKSNGFSHYHTRSFMSIPIFANGDLLGLISLADKTTGENFSQLDFAFASSVCRSASVIIENMLNFSRLRHEKSVLDREKSLLEKYASVGKLAAGIVHQINNPLDGVIRFTNILLSHIDQNSVGKEYLSEIQKGLFRIANITKSLLEFGHHFNPQDAHKKASTDVNRLLDESIEVFSPRISKSVSIIKHYRQRLPLVCDLGLAHVFVNIIKNSLDAMPLGGRLEIFTDAKKTGIEVVFKDTGCGIPEDFKEKIFEPFFTTKEKEKGAGLGLAICKEIVSRYHGEIKAESIMGRGSKFVIFIPTVGSYAGEK